MTEQYSPVSGTASETVMDITMLSASEIAQGIRKGTFSAREAVEAHIRRIEVVNPKLNAVVASRFEQALAEEGHEEDFNAWPEY